MIKLLIGGSPCTYWSIAQKNNRETSASGMGWELFKNYIIAKEKFKPDFFLYENNKSAAEAIKNQIKQELGVWDGSLFNEDSGVRYIEINSALVSAQNRQRFYVHNCGDVEQPQDRGILLKDILESQCYGCRQIGRRIGSDGKRKDYNFDIQPFQKIEVNENPQKTNCLSTVTKDNMVAQPINICQTKKSHTIKAQYFKNRIANGGHAAPAVAEPMGDGSGQYAIPTDNSVYEVKDGFITIKDKQYPIKLADGSYIIRKLTVTECCRLQTMPDNYCKAVSNSQAYKELGNGWTAEVIIHILNYALKDVPKDEEIVVLSMYDGIGTGRYCLDKMGFTNVKYFAYEIDKYAMAVAKDNYPDIIECGDAFQVRNEDWKLTEC